VKITLFKCLTGIAAVYHLALGLAGLLLPIDAFTGISELILGLRPEVDPQFELTAKFAAAYVLAFGVMLSLLCLNPRKYRLLAIPTLTLFGVRLINKLMFFGTIGESFDVPVARSVFAVASIAVLFFGILLTMPKGRTS